MNDVSTGQVVAFAGTLAILTGCINSSLRPARPESIVTYTRIEHSAPTPAKPPERSERPFRPEREDERPHRPVFEPAPEPPRRREEPPEPVIVRPTPEEIAAERARFLSRFLSVTNLSRSPGARTVAMAVGTEDGKLNRSFGTVLADQLKSNGIRLLPSLFRPEFVADGLFENAFNDPRGVLHKLELTGVLDVLLLAREAVEYSENPSLANVLTARMQMNVTSFEVDGTGQSRSWRYAASGAGFSEGDARVQAEERIVRQIVKDTNFLQTATAPEL